MAERRVRADSAKPVVRIEAGRTILRVGGVIQSVGVDEQYTPDVWDAMLPSTRPASALILGLGGGTIAHLLTQRWGALPITGVERDPTVALLARQAFGLAALPHVQIEMADAFEYVRACRETFDLICVDLYVAGKMAHGVLEPAFLRQIGRLLALEGTATFNFWRTAYLADQLRRLGRVLPIRGVSDAEDNVVAACGRPAALG
ncbi:MAG TPA: hypothetical protein VFU88_08730 [Ktedonobacterales bacterium]|nr:hypothetical protein [Ktedonobacterales bacterium]